MVCPQCKMALVKRGGVGGDAHEVLRYACPHHPEVISDKPGYCTICGMVLVERPAPAEHQHVYACPKHPDVVSVAPGFCATCGAALEKRLVKPGEAKPDEKKPGADRSVWVCDMHKEEVFDKPGECHKDACNGMKLVEKKLVPGAKLAYLCPDHPESRSEKPGVCPVPKCGKKLEYRIENPLAVVEDAWACPMHPSRVSVQKSKCPDCGAEMEHVEYDKVLALPSASVVDTGMRKVVFVDRGNSLFEAVEVVLGPRAGEYFQVLKGVNAGDRVVTAGAFLLDAETKLNPAEAATYFGASGQETKK